MANNSFGTLGGAYSILGQATTAEYNRRKREEDKARRRARRDARKDQLLAYFAQPLLKGAGEALAGGVTDLISGAVLGPNAKNYFQTEKGLIAAQKARTADTVEQALRKKRGQLTTGGKSAAEGQYALYKQTFREMLHEKYGSNEKNALLIDDVVNGKSDEIRAAAEQGLMNIDGLITYAGKSPDVSVLVKRAQNTDNFYGQSKGKRAMRQLLSTFTGKDLAAEGARYILTGSSDPDSLNRQIYVDLIGEDFEEKLAEKMRNVESFKRGKLGNILLAYEKENPELFAALSTSQKEEIENRTSDIQYKAEYNAALERIGAKNPVLTDFMQSPEGKKFKSMEALLSAFSESVSNISSQEATRAAAAFFYDSKNAEAVTKLEAAVGRSLFDVSDSDLKDIKEGTYDEKNYIEIQKESKAFISEVLLPTFSIDLSMAMKDLKPELVEELNLNVGSKRQLAFEYITHQLETNLYRSPDIAPTTFIGLFNIPFTGEEGVEKGSLRNIDAGRIFILNRVSGSAAVENLADLADKSGAAKEERNSKKQLVKPYYRKVDMPKTRELLNFVNDATLKRDDRASMLNTALSQLTKALEDKAVGLGHKNQDGSAHLSPLLIDELERLKEGLMSQIYPNIPALDYGL
jgi:hypothetical protein